MRQKLNLIVKRTLASVLLFAGMLAITNLETIMHEQAGSKVAKREKKRLAKESLMAKLNAPAAAPEVQGQAKALRESFAQDEFGDSNPFASLNNVDPLNALFAKGVKSFERTTFRSPDHQGEIGYDLLQYDIEHPGGGRSVVVAYLERPVLTSIRNVGTVDDRLPFVMVMVDKGEGATYSYYRSGNLLEQSEIPWTEARGMVAQRLNASVPFISVSR